MEGPDIKFRHELKYIVSAAEIELLKRRVSSIMQRDPHVGENGIYNIRSLYFDDFYNRCFYENENGNDPREKIRIRIYNHSSERISLECKRKERGKTLKTATLLTKDLAQSLIDGGPPRDIEALTPLVRKVAVQENTVRLRPVVIVEYERIPFIYKNGNVRVTFDTNVSSSSYCNRFWDEDIVKRPIMPEGTHLMEVKFDEFLPDFIYNVLNINTLRTTAYSKYYLCRKYTINS